MPCEGGGFASGEHPQEKLDKLTQLLCSQCKVLEELEKSEFIEAPLMTPEVREWWEDHKEVDRKREEAEKAAGEIERQNDLAQYNKLKKKLGL